MNNKFTEEDIKKALEQADANIEFEEVDVPSFENEKRKILKKEFKNE